jgi:hypothetical protein
MKIFCVFTPAHEVLLRDWFLPSLPADFEAVPIHLEINGAGDFLSEEFLRCIREKISLIVRSIRENPGEWIIWSDIDILFFEDAVPAIQTTIENAGEKCLIFQRERKWQGEVNTGFILIRCGIQAERFFSEVGERLAKERGKNEQAVINGMLGTGSSVPWDSLPVDFVARTHGWPPPARMAIYHANYTVGKDGVGQKIKQFRAVYAMRKHGFPARAYFIAVRAVEKAMQAFCFGKTK